MSSKKARPGLLILENVYSIAINPEFSYEEQLQSLAVTGHLANKTLLNSVVIKLCEYIDKQAEIIDSHERAINTFKPEYAKVVNRIEEIEKELKSLRAKKELNKPAIDPTQPLPTNS